MSPRRRKAEDADVFAALDVPDPDMFSSSLRADTDIPTLARMIEVTRGGSFLEWTLYREDSSAGRLREDLDATLRPYLARRERRDRRR